MISLPRIRRQHGFSLLEQTAVLPLLLLFIAGAVDINTLLQAKAALQDGVDASLRCVYTTDGKCVRAQADSRPRLYNYQLVTRHPEYLVDTFDFRGTASWINKPRYRFSNFQAQVLESVHYEAQSADLSVARRYFPARRTANYTLRRASMPFITGSARTPSAHFRGARQGFPASPAGEYPAHSSSLTGINLISSNSDVSTSYEFSVPAAATHRFEAKGLEQPSVHSSADFTRPIQDSTVNAVIHITGNKEQTEIGSLGGIEIQLLRFRPQHKDWGDIEPLGAQQLGRAAGEGTGANFVIRGLLPEFISPSVPEYEELHNYSPLRLRAGHRYQIRFTLRRQSGTVGWRGEQFKIFYPVEESRQEDFECLGGLPPCAPPQACQTEAPSEIFLSAPSVDQHAAPLRYDAELLLQSCSTGIVSIEEALHARGIFECSQNFEIRTAQNACPMLSNTHLCPPIGASSGGTPNFGVPQNPDASARIRQSAEALSICPPPSLGISGEAQSPRWSVVTAALPADGILPGSDGTLVLTKENCTSALEWPAGSSLASYPHLSYVRAPDGFEPHFTGDLNPRDLCSDPASGFACSEFSVLESSVDVSPESVHDENRASLFFGLHAKPSCAWEELLRSDAIAHRLMPAQAYFEAEAPALSAYKERWIAEPDTCSDPFPEIAWSEPDRSERVAGGPFVEGELPAACRAAGASCSAEFVGFGSGAGSAVSYDYKLASEHFGFNQLRSHYPRARWNCREKDCVTINVLRDGPFMVADGSIFVPLYVLGSGTVELRASGRERREAEFSR